MYYERDPILDVKDGVEGYKRVHLDTSKRDEKGEIRGEESNVIIDIPEWELAAVMTEEVSDLNEGRNKRAIYITEKLFEVFDKHDVKACELNVIAQKLVGKLNIVEDEATNRAFGVENSEEIRLSHWREKE